MADTPWYGVADPEAWSALGNAIREGMYNDGLWQSATGFDPMDTNFDGHVSPGEAAIQNAKNLGQWNDEWDRIVRGDGGSPVILGGGDGGGGGSKGSGGSGSGGGQSPWYAYQPQSYQPSNFDRMLDAQRNFRMPSQYSGGGGGYTGGSGGGSPRLSLNDQKGLMGYENQLSQQLQQQKLNMEMQMLQQRMQAEREIAAGNNQTQLQISQNSANASRYPHTLANSRWGQIFPLFQSLMEGGTGTGTGGSGGGNWWSDATSTGSGSAAGGSGYIPVGTQPKIDAGPIWSDNQINAQVNAQIAANNARTAGQNRRIAQDLGSRGFGSRSPLAMALTNQGNMANMAANAASDRTIRWDAASGNAQQLLNSQKAQEAQFASRQAEQLENQKNQLGYKGSLINALMGGWK